VTQSILEKTVLRAASTGAAAPVIPIVDTVKSIDGEVITGTVDRSALAAIQTPQIFEAGLIKVAVEKAIADGEVLTDDCACVERLGMKVAATEGSRENIKITTPFDLLLGSAILETRVREGRSK
jgi:2-C-methyl-D-erythritol 4-phosphate cytidylyltransferase